ncbi:glycoside hydrolase [Serendipita vermifera]|nr:glycoside hydrolase [Serendipita vermifera]
MDSGSSHQHFYQVRQYDSTAQFPVSQQDFGRSQYPERSASYGNHGAAAINNNGDYPFAAPPPHFRGRPAIFDNTYHSSSSASLNYQASDFGSTTHLRNDDYHTPSESHAMNEMGSSEYSARGNYKEKQNLYEAPRTKSKRKGLFWAFGVLLLLLAIAAVVIPLYFFVLKKDGGPGSSSGRTNGTNTGLRDQTWGGDGSTVKKEDGTTFIYNNTFGGYWVYDSENPLNNSARAQDYSPALSEPWKWGEDVIYGVNLGGWLNLEPFISPAMYEPFFPNAVDEWTLCEHLLERDGNLDALEEHYKTFIVEEDFAMIAAAGLNWVRIPVPFWIIETYPGEPFLARVGWTYFLKAIQWARKYGIRINLDLHAVPGSQNGWNHSGKTGQINFLSGVMGIANAQRTLDYIRILAEFISQPEYSPVVPFFGILNEPYAASTGGIPIEAMQQFYAEAYRIVRKAGGLGDGNGPVISMHESFQGLGFWAGFLDGADRLALDEHPYLVFGTLTTDPVTAFPARPCSDWGAMTSDSLANFGLTAAGEWSYAINDCGLYVTEVAGRTRYEGTWPGHPTRIGDCTADGWLDYRTWDETIKESLRGVGMSSMDALGNSFFWTWRIGESLETGRVMSPFWSYKLSIQEGWAVTDPRTSKGNCARLGLTGNTFTGSLTNNQVGGPGAGENVPTLDSYVWPPTSVTGYENANRLPRYTPTGAISTMPVPTSTGSANVNWGTGWNNPDDTDLMNVPIAGCEYPDPWDALNATIPVC